MPLTPWDPFKNLLALQERMNQLFDETMERGRDKGLMPPGTWVPAVDIYETGEDIFLVAELPGMDKKDVDIQISENTLRISGERKMEKSVKEENYQRVERAYGKFSRSFNLPSSVEQERITASYKKGVLEIRLPKAHKAMPQQIKIDVKG